MKRQTLVNHFLEDSALARPGKVALVHQGQRLTYAELNGRADALAAFLAGAGLARGDRAAVFMDNSVEAVVSIFAILKAGGAFLLVNPSTKTEKLDFILRDSRASVMLTQSSRLSVARAASASSDLRVVVVAGDTVPEGWVSYESILAALRSTTPLPPCIDLDLAAVIYTSGSAGVRKGAMLSHLNMVSAADSITTYLENAADDIIANVLPLSFDYGLYQVLMAFKIGGTLVLEKSFAYPYQVINTLIRQRVTGLPGVPTLFAMLLGLKGIDQWDFSSLRYLTSTGAVLPVPHIRRLRELFPRAKLYSMYGLTECKRVSFLPPEQLEQRPASVGRGMPNEEVYLVDEAGRRTGPGTIGELVVRGSNVMLGYWGLPEATAACLKPGRYPGERVLHTGDIFRMDDEGYLYFVSRKDDVIKSRGEKVSPREVENVLCQLEGIREAAVVGVPDDILGQAIAAFVVVEPGARLTERAILKHCADRLENLMVPRHVVILDALPTLANGKIDKKSLLSLKRPPAPETGDAPGGGAR